MMRFEAGVYEITPTMIGAGLEHLFRYHPDNGLDAEDTVKLIYLAMLAANENNGLKEGA